MLTQKKCTFSAVAVQSTSSESLSTSIDYNALTKAFINVANPKSLEDSAAAAAKKKPKTGGAAGPTKL